MTHKSHKSPKEGMIVNTPLKNPKIFFPTLAYGILAGAVAGLITGITEACLGSGGKIIPTIFVASGLLIPIGGLAGLGLVIAGAILPEGQKPTDWFHRLKAKHDANIAAKILVFGFFSLGLLPLVYRIIFTFLTKFNHHGLAALFLTFSLIAISVLWYLLAQRTTVTVARFLSKPHFISNFLGKPLIAVSIVSIGWLIACIPPLLKGGESAEGIFGFIGFLTLDGLGAGPLVSIIAIGGIALTILWLLSIWRPGGFKVMIPCLLIVLTISPMVAGLVSKSNTSTFDRLGKSGGLAPVMGKVVRKLGDKDNDGHARWMGGQDCNDNDAHIHPGAQEVPNNGIDEDCSGEDLNLAKLKAQAEAEKKVATTKQATLIKPTFPEDVSVFLLTVDALRWDAPGFMGYKRNVTPNLDKLVENATIYDQAYSLSSYTSQSVTALMTGKYPSELKRNNKHKLRVSLKENFAAELLCTDSIRCGAVVSHFIFGPHYGWHQGFHDWYTIGGEPKEIKNTFFRVTSPYIANQAIRWLKKPQNTEGRFFFWVHFMDPHSGYLQHEGFKNFGPKKRDKYDHEVLYTDHYIGKVIDYFKTLPAAERTIIIVSADHGESFNEHGRWYHGFELYEENIRVPLAIVGPGIPKKRIARPTSQIDLFPTFLDIFNQPIPKYAQGRSLLPDWVKGQQLASRPIIADQNKNEKYEARRVYIKDNWKLHHLPDTGGYRLFRLDEKGEQTESLVESEPEAFKRIKDQYDLFQALEFKPLPPVNYTTGKLENMPDPM